VLLVVPMGLDSAGAAGQPEPRGRIVFEGCRGVCSVSDSHTIPADLFAIDVRSGKRVQLTRTGGFESQPAVSGDGAWLAYSRIDRPEAVSKIWVSRTSGSSPRQLTRGRDLSPSWLNSEYVYFTRWPLAGCGSIFRVAKEGGPAQLVVRQQGDESVFSPSVASDGRLAYGSADCEARLDCCYLEVVDSRGRETDDLAKLPRSLEAPGRPAWSPGGELIAFGSGYDPRIVWVARRDGSHLRRISPRTLSASGPTWSPDGRWIAFEGLGTTGSSDIYIARVDGSEIRRITRTPTFSESSPAWAR
jgi:Tol biopolymer transport system component